MTTPVDADYSGKVAIVTGAAVGLGNAFARRLAAAGAKVAICDVREEELAALAADLGGVTFAQKADVSDSADVKKFVDATIEQFGKIDMLVSNAGVWAASEGTDSVAKTLQDYAYLVNTNLRGVFLFGRAVIPHMIAQGGGEILNISTDHHNTCGSPYTLDHHDAPDCPWHVDGPRPTGGGTIMDLYDASKWGINGLIFAWAQALSDKNIRVNGFCMGATDSYMLRGFHNFDPPEEEVAQWMKAEDIAEVMMALFEDGRSGENINFTMGHPVELPHRNPAPYVYPAIGGVA